MEFYGASPMRCLTLLSCSLQVMLHPAHAAALLNPTRGLLPFAACPRPPPFIPTASSLRLLGQGFPASAPAPPSNHSATPPPRKARMGERMDKETVKRGNDGVAASSTQQANSFVKKLYHMVTTRDPDIISFTEDGLSFHVKDPKRLEQEVLPHYFRHSRFQSLVRQLNFYNFKKTSKERVLWIYTHSLFQLDRPDLLESLKRKPSTNAVVKGRTAPLRGHSQGRRDSSLAAGTTTRASSAASTRTTRGSSISRSTSSNSHSSSSGTSYRKRRRTVRGIKLSSSDDDLEEDEDEEEEDGRMEEDSEDEDEEHNEDEEQEEEDYYYYGMYVGDSDHHFAATDEEDGAFDGDDSEMAEQLTTEESEEEEEDEEENDEEVEAQAAKKAPLLLLLKQQGVLMAKPTPTVAVKEPVDLTPYQPADEEVASWEALRSQWASAMGDHGDEVLFLSERLPTSHLHLCRFFLTLAPYSTTGDLATGLRDLVSTSPALTDSLLQHYQALDPSNAPLYQRHRGFLSVHASSAPPSPSASSTTSGTALAAVVPGGTTISSSVEESALLRTLLAYGLNHLKEAVASLDTDDAARPSLETCLDLWMQHAARFY